MSLNKKLLFVIDTWNYGGAEKQVSLLAEELSNSYEVRVLSLNKEPGLILQKLIRKNIQTSSISILRQEGYSSVILNLIKLYSILIKLSPDIILPFTYYPNILSNTVWKWTFAKKCYWNQRDEGRRMTGGWLERKALNNTFGFVSNSTEGINFLVRHKGIQSNQIKLIRNGIKIENNFALIEDYRAKLGIEASVPVVTMVANLSPNKDHSTLIKAWALIQKSYLKNKPVLILAGDDRGMKTKLLELSRELGVDELIKFVGFVNSVQDLLKITDVFVFSSYNEGCPNAILEAMSMKKPIIATRTKGIMDALGNEYKYYFDPGDSEALATLACKLLINSNERNLCSDANFSRASSIFSIDKMFTEYLKLLT